MSVHDDGTQQLYVHDTNTAPSPNSVTPPHNANVVATTSSTNAEAEVFQRSGKFFFLLCKLY